MLAVAAQPRRRRVAREEPRVAGRAGASMPRRDPAREGHIPGAVPRGRDVHSRASACATCRSQQIERMLPGARASTPGEEGRDLRPGRHVVRDAPLLPALLPRLPHGEPRDPRRRHREVAGRRAARSRRIRRPRRSPEPSGHEGERATCDARLPELVAASGDRARATCSSMRSVPSIHYGATALLRQGGPHSARRAHARRGLLQRRQDLQVAGGDPPHARATLGIRPEQEIHTHCGGGGAASVPYFALKHLRGLSEGEALGRVAAGLAAGRSRPAVLDLRRARDDARRRIGCSRGAAG